MANPCYNVVLAGFVVLMLAMKVVNSNEELSFNFNIFDEFARRRLTLLGDAGISASGILALPNDPSISQTTSRALFKTPVPIWDSTTGNVASFVTSFSVDVSDIRGKTPGDGFVFFLAPPSAASQIPNNSAGGYLGVIDSSKAFNEFVGVEFDSYINPWDPNYYHVGIDVNSIISLNTIRWSRSRSSSVTITYNSLNLTLSVAVDDGTGQISTVDQEIDLRTVLPKKVIIGFSATTTPYSRERHDIYSWSFSSILKTTPGATATTTTTEENINVVAASYA